jgi:hypothetical protein
MALMGRMRPGCGCKNLKTGRFKPVTELCKTTIFNSSAKGFYKKEFGFERRALGRRVRQKLLTNLT